MKNRAMGWTAWWATATIAATMSLPAAAQPQQPHGYTWGELALLPEYCKDAQGILYGDATNPSPRAGQWVTLMGQDFWHIHHYCRALQYVNKAQAPGIAPSVKAAHFARAQGDYEYMLKNASQKMPLMPEIWLRYGEYRMLLGDVTGAKDAFDRSRALKPDYWPAYTRWIDVQIGLKQFEQAKALAQEGLRFAPDNVDLQERLATLERSIAGSPAPKNAPRAKTAGAAESARK